MYFSCVLKYGEISFANYFHMFVTSSGKPKVNLVKTLLDYLNYITHYEYNSASDRYELHIASVNQS